MCKFTICVSLWLAACAVISQSPSRVLASTESGTPVLDSLISVALEKNPSVVSAGHRHESVRYAARASGSLPDPQLSVALSNLPKGSLSLSETPMSGIAIGLSQQIPWPGKLGAKSRLAELEADISRLETKSIRDDVVAAITTAYYQYVYRVEEERILVQNVGLVEAMAEVARTNYENGTGTAQDLLRARTTIAKLENRIAEAQQIQTSSLVLIGGLTDNMSTVPTDLTVVLPDMIPLSSVDTYLAAASSDNPQLARAEVRTDQASARKSLVKAAYWPDIMLGLEYRIRDNGLLMDPVEGRDFLSAKVSLSLPLWFSRKQKNNSRAAEAALQASRSQRLATERRLEYEIRDSYQTLSRLVENFRRYDREIIPLAETAVESADISYRVGQLDFVHLLSAQLELLDARLQRVHILATWHQQLAVLEELSGLSHREVIQ